MDATLCRLILATLWSLRRDKLFYDLGILTR
jgi:hypothetical protein